MKKVFFFSIAAASMSTAIATEENDFLYSFLVGSYAVVGKNPDGGIAYSGTADITFDGKKLILVKHMASRTVKAEGHVERASADQVKVVRFTWPGHEATCLPSSDLDNYGRLTCYWTVNGQTHKEPGLESYFSTAAWPR